MQIKDELQIKRKLRKRISYYKRRDEKFDFAVCLDCEKRKNQIAVLKAEVAKKISEPHKQILVNFFNDGEIQENVQMAILELTALDVATCKVCDVIEVDARQIFHAHCTNKLSRKTVQNIVDAGQYIAKTFINKEVLENDSLGIAKDGTTRQKIKTQETNVLLSNGKHYSLGFSSLASETGEAIENDVEAKLDELAAVAGESDFKAKALQTLAFLISDRAANEKKSNKIINE
ncbi:hypothetical protein PoB_002129700 [Plakobranchus ocellatus]|uniref:Uncharacterized protein n=1 Tax=Plakobranchus ocellatus TaxID=259542 RepID=A0AAV3ZJS3_9GAST|nr:hypothetical protein PoB_002129700 [Plakobranchus ocellatus]